MYNLHKLLSVLQDLVQIRKPVTVSDVCALDSVTSADCFTLRCDIERDLPHAVDVAERLHDIGVCCSMYFRATAETYQPKVFTVIRQLGHEIGYHHECLDRSQGDFAAARNIFLREIELFREDGFPLRTVCGHGSTCLRRKPYPANWWIFKRYPDLLTSAGLLGEVYTTILRERSLTYASDTFRNYPDFWQCIRHGVLSPAYMMVLVHPHRWRFSLVSAGWEVAKDLADKIKVSG
jgi:hypothetical protein